MDKINFLQFFYNKLLPAIDNLAELKIALLFVRISIYLKKLTHQVSVYKLAKLAGLSLAEAQKGLLAGKKRQWLNFVELTSLDFPVFFTLTFPDQKQDQISDPVDDIYINKTTDQYLIKELKEFNLNIQEYVQKNVIWYILIIKVNYLLQSFMKIC